VRQNLLGAHENDRRGAAAALSIRPRWHHHVAEELDCHAPAIAVESNAGFRCVGLPLPETQAGLAGWAANRLATGQNGAKHVVTDPAQRLASRISQEVLRRLIPGNNTQVVRYGESRIGGVINQFTNIDHSLSPVIARAHTPVTSTEVVAAYYNGSKRVVGAVLWRTRRTAP
jgi:hypothetical protein